MSVKTIRWAEITLRNKETAADSVIYCTEREFDGVTISAELRSRVWPIFISANSFGSAMDNYLPNAASGSVTLNSGHESFGHERRFIDLLERYTIQGQKCRVALAEIDIDADLEFPITPDYYLDLTMRAWSYSKASGTITLSVSGGGIEPSVISYQIKKSIPFTSGTVEPFPESVGRSLPIVIGRDVELASYRFINNDFAYCMRPQGHSYSSNFEVLLQNSQGEYVEIESKVNTDLLAKPYESGKTNGGTLTPGLFTKFAHPCRPTQRALVNKIGLHIGNGTISGAVPGSPNQISLELYAGDGDILPDGAEAPISGNLAPGTLLAGGWVSVEYTRPATEMIVTFERPVVVEANQLYWVVWNLEKDRQYSLVWNKNVYTDPGVANVQGQVYGQTDNTSSGAGINWGSVGLNRLYYSLYGVAITDVDVVGGFDNQRVPHAIRFTSSTDTTLDGTRSVGGVFPTNFDSLKPVIIRDGILDNASGNVTGTPSLLIEKPEHAARMFQRLSKPSGLISPGINTATFSQVSATPADYSYRLASGGPQGRTTYDKALRDLCRSTQCRIARRGNGLAFFAEGIRQDTVARFEDSECRVISIREFDGTRTIINRAEIYYSKSIINSSVAQGASDGRFQNYNLNSFFDDANSISLYGERELLVEAMEYLGDQTSGDRIARLLVDKWSEPAIFVDMALPLAKAKGVDLLDVIEITSAELHAFFGTSYKAKAPSYDGELVDQGGMYEKRAKKWRGIIEARDIAGSPSGATELILSVRLFSPRDINY